MYAMAFLSTAERTFLEAASRLAFCNPFLPERLTHERAALGKEFVDEEPVWSFSVSDPDRPRHNVWKISARLEELCPRLRAKLAGGAAASDSDLVLYEDAVLNLLYQRYYTRLVEGRWQFYKEFLHDWRIFFDLAGRTLPSNYEPAHTFACF